MSENILFYDVETTGLPLRGTPSDDPRQPHLVQFAAAGERVELIHRATNRDIFARGALHAAVRLHGRAPGRYRVADLL